MLIIPVRLVVRLVAAVDGTETVLVLLKVVAVDDESELSSMEVTALGATVPGSIVVLGTVSDVVTLHSTIGVLKEVPCFVVGTGVDV